MLPFDPDFDDARWTLDWITMPIRQVPTGRHPDGYAVVEQRMTRAQIFDRYYETAESFSVHALLDTAGKLWMSDTPQERMMMYNNASASRGHILIGGLGLALYPQYAAARADRFTIVEQSRAVAEIVGPTLDRALRNRPQPVSFRILLADVDGFLSAPPLAQYDTIFLDTWDTLDAANLPTINGLRDQAIRHLAPNGRVLLWGYRWMVRLFETACRQLLRVPPGERKAWLTGLNQPEAAALLRPVVDRFKDVRRTFHGASHMEAALKWCREYIADARPAVTRSSESGNSGRDKSSSGS